MKSEKSLKKSADAALHSAVDNCQKLGIALVKMESPQKSMPKIRAILAELNQRIHEYNAYKNSLETE